MDKALTFERFCDKLFTQEVFDVVYTIEQIRDIAVPIARSYGVSSLSLFGSYARGEATEDSDIDILVDCGAIRCAFQWEACMLILSEGLGKELDLVTTNHRDKAFDGFTKISSGCIRNISLIRGMDHADTRRAID